MKAKDEKLTATQFNTYVSGSYYPANKVNVLYLKDKVTRGPLVKGDHRSPKPWNYTTRLSTWPIASADCAWYYPKSNESIGKTWATWRTSGPRENFGTWGSIYDAEPWGSDSRPSWLYNSALERLYDRLRGNLDLSIALAEAGTTGRMLKSYTSWERFVESLPRVRRKSDLYYFFPKLIGNSWLQWTYGWKPLINDIYNAADEAVRTIPKGLVVRSSATQRYDNTYARSFPITGMPVGKYRRVGAQTVRFKCRYRLPEKDFSIDRWTSLNPVSIAWELMPYSFVVDWFIDIGSALRSFETSVLYRTLFEEGYWTWHQWYDTTVRFDRYVRLETSNELRTFLWHSNPTATERYRSFQRYVLLTSPRPRAPTFHVDLSWRRLLSSAALLAQRMGR